MTSAKANGSRRSSKESLVGAERFPLRAELINVLAANAWNDRLVTQRCCASYAFTRDDFTGTLPHYSPTRPGRYGRRVRSVGPAARYHRRLERNALYGRETAQTVRARSASAGPTPSSGAAARQRPFQRRRWTVSRDAVRGGRRPFGNARAAQRSFSAGGSAALGRSALRCTRLSAHAGS